MSKWELPKEPQFYNWESPVNLISQYVDEQIKEMHKQEEKTIMAEITHKLGVDIDKQELINALNYDRGQYEKGYADGRASLIEENDKLKEQVKKYRKKYKRFKNKYLALKYGERNRIEDENWYDFRED